MFSIIYISFFNAEVSNAIPLHSRLTQNFLIKEKENSIFNKDYFISLSNYNLNYIQKSQTVLFLLTKFYLLFFSITIGIIKLKMSWFFGNKNYCLSEASFNFVFKKFLDEPGIVRSTFAILFNMLLFKYVKITIIAK